MARIVRTLTEEPLGIVISRGRGPDPRPAFWAYVWAEEEEGAKRALVASAS